MTELTILFLGANPNGQVRLRLTDEVRAIEDALAATTLGRDFKLITVWASRFDDLMNGLLKHRPAVVHFSGHGRPDALLFEAPDGSVAPVPNEALAALFATQAVQLVVFNACDSASAARAVAPHVQCAVGTLEPVGDLGAKKWAAAFYRGLGYGRSVAEAYELGRSAIMAASLPGAEDVVLVPHAGVDPTTLFLQAGAPAQRTTPVTPSTPPKLNDIARKALDAGLVDPGRRDDLLAGLPRGFIASLPRSNQPLDQLRSDLRKLRSARLRSVPAPLAVWLRNAAELLDMDDHPDAALFTMWAQSYDA